MIFIPFVSYSSYELVDIYILGFLILSYMGYSCYYKKIE